MKRDAEQVIGRIRNDGGWDRRYRPYTAPERYVDDWRRTVLEVVAGVVVLGALIVGIVWWAWIAAASRIPTP